MPNSPVQPPQPRPALCPLPALASHRLPAAHTPLPPPHTPVSQCTSMPSPSPSNTDWPQEPMATARKSAQQAQRAQRAQRVAAQTEKKVRPRVSAWEAAGGKLACWRCGWRSSQSDMTRCWQPGEQRTSCRQCRPGGAPRPRVADAPPSDAQHPHPPIHQCESQALLGSVILALLEGVPAAVPCRGL